MLVVKWMALGFAAATLAGTALAADSAPPKFQNYVTPGNLESPHNLGCIQIHEASPQYNPVDLYRSAKICLGTERYEDAFNLVRLAAIYGRFDMLRVADNTAHQAVAVARMEVFANIPEAVKLKFSEVAGKHTANPQDTANLCVYLKPLGPPTYRATYMIEHGINAFLAPNENGLVKDFDPDKAWADVLRTYVKCAEVG